MSKNIFSDQQKLAIFRGKQVRRLIYKNEWWFVINDVIVALSESTNPTQYLKNIRKRDESFNELFIKGGVHIEPPLAFPFQTPGGRQKLLCWNTEAIFRLIQSIPSPKAEPFKRWLARVGYERIQEIEDPELATKRTRALYKAKGYSDAWIEKRMRGIEVRETLTDEWQKRGVKEGAEYAILTAEISQATFGMTPSEYKNFKGLKRQNLRDHMNDLELIFAMLGEASTTEITKNKNAQGFTENKQAAQQGGAVAGKARKDLEMKSGKRVSNTDNYLQTSESRKRLK